MDTEDSTATVVTSRWALVWLGIGCALLMAGCGPDRPVMVPVTGTVTYNGKLTEGAQVTFVAEGARAAFGVTDAKGRFELMTLEKGDGAMPGEHMVLISKSEIDPTDWSSTYPRRISVLPQKYSNPVRPELKAMVTADGQNDFRFDLTP